MPININFYNLSEISDADLNRIMLRSEADIKNVEQVVRPIIADIKENGDKAVIKYAKQFDSSDISQTGIKATEQDFINAENNLEPEIKQAINHCIKNVRKFHEEQFSRIEKFWLSEVENGVTAGEIVNPIQDIGIYVPRGKGCFPSVMYMLCVPAVVAKVPNIVVVTPPNDLGMIDDASLYAAQQSGVKNIYKVGGSQAVASLAYGTETIPKVSKMVGPGNAYVAAARRILADKLDPGMPAGPSEALILADSTAHVYNTALDILNEAEHGADSASVLVTDSQELAMGVNDLLPKLISELPEKRRDFCTQGFSKNGYSAIILTNNLQESIDFANKYAVEHLLLKVENPSQVLPKLRNTGEVLIGEYSPIAMGNYGIGVNAILPTGRHGKTYSATSVWDFLIRTTVAYNNKQGYEGLATDVENLTVYEGFTAHGDVIRKRQTLTKEQAKQQQKSLEKFNI